MRRCPYPLAVDSRRPKDDSGKLMSMGKDRFLSHPLTPAVKRNRLTGVRLLFAAAVSAWPCRCLAGDIDEFLKTGIIFETRMDQVFRSSAIYVKIGFLFDRSGHTCQMEHPIDTPYGLF